MPQHPRYPLLQMVYDERHRGRIHEERTEVLKPLRPRLHKPLTWDDRYAPYFKRAGFLLLAWLVNAGLPRMDNAALTALVDRLRPETHTFHLPAGEMTVTLQDVAMLFGLRIDGRAVTGTICPNGWRDRVELLLGVHPPEPPEDAKDKKPT
ncbi:protein MAIN-LIKE 2-like [Panicum virgatum]|uniref:protein MAIN-LIKE 2-like n=1 Tax=Panicum virgatum TaxID=38727 RepID=UPI0019D59102|nr:protein MAIN-LIKE 2-like [Panicum virgatum]